MLGIAIALLMQATSPQVETIAPGSPRWLSSPGPKNYERDFPKAARAAFLNGRADLLCRVQPDGGLGDCRTENVAPAEGGFGEAALKLRGMFRLGRSPGQELPAQVRVPFAFNTPADVQAGAVSVKHPEVEGVTVYVDCRYGERGLDNCVTGDNGRAGELAVAFAASIPVPKMPRPAGRISIPLAFAGASASKQGVVTGPQWVRRPTGEDIARVYPNGAMRMGVEGRATTSCTVSAEGLLFDCVLEEEAPGGAGFGTAALRLMPLFKMQPMTLDGEPVTGGTVRIPMRFVLPR